MLFTHNIYTSNKNKTERSARLIAIHRYSVKCRIGTQIDKHTQLFSI